MQIEYEGDPLEDRPEANVVRFEETMPVPHRRSDIGANADRVVWQFDQPDNSRWFDKGELHQLDPGVYTDFQSHREATEGVYEVTYRVMSGEAVLRTEYWDRELDRFDAVRIPPGTAYQLGNRGDDPLWIACWASVGGDELQEASWLEPAERPGAQSEYERIMAVRADKGLPAMDVDYDGPLEPAGSEPNISDFSETKPVSFSLSPEVGNNSQRLDWIDTFPDATYLDQGGTVEMDPGVHLAFHSHPPNEGPYEEIYWVAEGRVRLRTEYWDTTLEQFDFVHCPTGCAHSVGNAGTEPAWFVVFATQGGAERDAAEQGVFDKVEPAERQTVVEEYKRIMAARKKRDLPIPRDVDVRIVED